MTETVSVQLDVPEELRAGLAQLASLSGQSPATIAATALAHYLDWRLPHLLELEEAIAAADRGEFATAQEVSAVFAKYGA